MLPGDGFNVWVPIDKEVLIWHLWNMGSKQIICR